MPTSPIMPVGKGNGLSGGSFQSMNGDFLLKVSSEQTEGRLTVFDTIRTQRGGPPQHYHEAQDEWFQVVDGVFDILVDGAVHRLGAGDSILGPARQTHAFTNVSETGRLLLVFTPAGRMEAFFRVVGTSGSVSPEVFSRISADHGMIVTGPPLQIRTS